MSNQQINPLQMYSIKETCKLLGISRNTLHALTTNSEIPAYRVGGRVLYKAMEIQSLIENGKMKTAA